MQQYAGLLFFLSGALVLLGILTAEILYPTQYSISQNMVSNLAATPAPNSITYQPSASIFDYSLIVAGVLIVLGAFLLQKTFQKKSFTSVLVCMGIGTAGVGIFPAFDVMVHPLVSLLAFVSGGIAAIMSFKVIKPPFSFLAILLGIASLLFLCSGIIFPLSLVAILGRGGAERLVLYPLIIWLLGFGGYLMHALVKKSQK